MPTLQSVIAVTLAGFALSATPGPSMFYVLSRTIGQSRAAGLASALGMCLGGVILAIATAFGLATLFAAFDWLVTVLRHLGSLYLAWLGIDMIRGARAAARADFRVEEVPHRPLATIMWQGALVEVLNPKTVLFFALFLPPFVVADAAAPGAADVTLQLLVLGALVPLTAVPADLLVAFLGGTLAGRLRRSTRARECLAWLGGVVLLCIAVSLHL